MSFWTNPVKAVTSWVRPLDAFLKAVLPPPLYVLVKKLLSNEMKAIGILAQASAQDIWDGKKTVPQLADEILKVMTDVAREDVLDAVRAYTTKTGG